MASILPNYPAKFLPYQNFPKNALNVGLGCGDTSQWFSLHGINVTTLEIDPAVIEINEKILFSHNIKHNIEIADGRNWLLKTDQTFDVITWSTIWSI